MSFKKIMNSEWTTLETVASRMKKEYPYYFFISAKEDIDQPRHAWYEVCNEEEEKRFLGAMNKQLKYKGTKVRP